MAQQGDQDAQQLVQMLQGEQGGQQPMSAKLGGKLRTVQILNNRCPEGFELKLFRAGGTLCKKCMKKAEDGAKIDKKDKPLNAAEEFKMKRTKTKKEAKPNQEKKVNKKEVGGLITPKAVEVFKSFKQGGNLTRNKVILRTKNK
jgi:hypothetical protein